MSETHPYDALSPDLILDSVEAFGLIPDGHLMALNSYENRVYQLGIDLGDPIVGKFYRPERWSDEQIQEEHDFSLALAEAEIPVIAPLQNESGYSLITHEGFKAAFFPRRGGRNQVTEDPEQLEWLGRYLGRIHAVGSAQTFQHRPRLDIQSFGDDARQIILDSPHLPLDLASDYGRVSAELLDAVRRAFDQVGDITYLRTHGDFHHGNILWTDHGPHVVDLDDSRMTPAIQDLWMLLHGDRRDMTMQLSDILEGYRDFHDFDAKELALIEPLRTLRQIHYCAWLSRRFDDPAFPPAFPWFGTHAYWQEQIQGLQEQKRRLEEPPLQVY